MRPFDIVWFSGRGEAPMLALALLPGGEEERKARGKSHHFALVKSVPTPNLDGTLGKGKSNCVYTDRLGAECLRPAEYKGEGLAISEVCNHPLTRCAGVLGAEFIGGYIKPEFWQRPDVQTSAKERETQEQETKVIIDRELALKRALEEHGKRKAERMYWQTVARLVLLEGREAPKNLKTKELQQIAMAGMLTGVKLPDKDTWMALAGLKQEQPPEETAYDPRTFLKFAWRT